MIRFDTTPPKRKAPQAKTPLPSFEEFINETQRLKDKAMAVLREDGHHCATLILYTDRGVEVGGMHVTGDRAMHEYVRAIIKARGAKAFIAITESWMVMDLHGVATNVRPSQHPERRKALVVSAVHPAGSRMWAIPFSREGNQITYGRVVDSGAMGMDVRGGIPEALSGED